MKIISIFAIVFLIGCSPDSEDTLIIPIEDDYDLEIARGWISFSSDDYQGALHSFGKASKMESLDARAYIGLGWCYAMIDKLDDAIANFDYAIAREPSSPDGYAGKAFILMAKNEFEKTIEIAFKAITLGNEGYIFSQIPDVNLSSLRLLLAECYYAMGNYAEAMIQVDIIEPYNKLDRNSRNFKQDLLAELERLKSDIQIMNDLNI